MTSRSNSLRAAATVSPPEMHRRSAEIIAFSAAREPSRYGEGRRPNMFALAGALGVAGLFLSSLLTMNVIGAHQDKSSLKVITLLAPPEPPPPPPPQRQPEPVEQAEAPPPIVAPTPLVVAPSPPVQIAASPVPPPPVVRTPGPPSPAPAAPSPAVESAGDLSSTMISATPPRYPHESRRRREQGTVVLTVLLSVDGSVADVSVSQSSGFERLDQAALTAVRRWRWSPTQRNGAPVMVRGLVEIPFVLRTR